MSSAIHRGCGGQWGSREISLGVDALECLKCGKVIEGQDNIEKELIKSHWVVVKD